MPVKTYQRLRGVLLIVIFFLPAFATAQITITQNDLLNLVGKRFVSLTEGADTLVTVNVGSAGENQVWDLRSVQVIDSVYAEALFLNPATLPGANNFPSANLAETIRIQDIIADEDGNFVLTRFFSVQENYFIEVGDSSVFTSSQFDTTMISSTTDTMGTLPATYGSSWSSVSVDTSGFFPAVATINTEKITALIDGWGTLKLPMGDFEALRLREISHEKSQSIINGMVTTTTEDSSISYTWLSKDNYLLASLTSPAGVTDPNFTLARDFFRLDTVGVVTTGITQERTGLPEVHHLLSNYPNPFNPETRIHFTTRSSGTVSVQIFDLNGRLVTTLFEGTIAAGTHQLMWNGRDAGNRILPSGIYFLQMRTADGAIYQHKMLLAK